MIVLALGLFIAGQFMARLFIPAHFIEETSSSPNALSFPRIDEAKLYCDN
jgi:hypothetical protein